MFVTYNQYIKALYQERCQNPVVKKIYHKEGGFKKFKRQYIYGFGFSEYLQYISNTALSAIQVYHVARMYSTYGKRSNATLPMVLSSISRQYNLELPAVQGILSQEYWDERFQLNKLQTTKG